MKKILVMLFAILGLTINANAQTAQCKISGSTDGATVVASVIEVGDGYVLVELDNDGTFAVNVTIKVTGTVSGAGNGTRSAKVYPSQSTSVKVPVSGAESDKPTSNYRITISGSRCN